MNGVVEAEVLETKTVDDAAELVVVLTTAETMA